MKLDKLMSFVDIEPELVFVLCGIQYGSKMLNTAFINEENFKNFLC